jgi:hypothetical protein
VTACCSGTPAGATREKIAAKAREYLGTPYRHQGRVKGRAMDCLGLVICVAEELALADAQGKPFRRDQHLDYPRAGDSRRLMAEFCGPRLVEVSQVKIGSIVLLRLARDPVHLAIAGTMQKQASLIHVRASRQRHHSRFFVVEQLIDQKWRNRIVKVFDFPGISG